MGSIAGVIDNNATITNCYNTGLISAETSVNYSTSAGGIVGYLYRGSVTNCYNTGSASAATMFDDSYAGGIAGLLSGYVTNCYNTGDVSASSAGDVAYTHAGGIAGALTGFVTNCYNTGNVSASCDYSAYAGGIAGYNYGAVTACYYLDNMSTGVGDGNGTTTACTAEQMKLQSTFTDFDFDTVWTISGNEFYPFPELKNTPMVTVILIGDVDGNGSVTVADALKILRVAVGLTTF